MKYVYPAFIKQSKSDYLIYIPDIDRATQGHTFFDAIRMGRDLLGTYSLDQALPEPGDPAEARKRTAARMDDDCFRWSDGTLVYIDVDADEYRRRHDTRSVRKNCTIPAWLNREAEEAGINFSRVLQDALLKILE